MQTTQLSFSFEDKQTSQSQPNQKSEVPIKEIPGLRYIENYINEDEQADFLTRVDEGDWLEDLKRRVQHYGFKYNYKARRVDMSMYVSELPKWLKDISDNLVEELIMEKVADQVIVNEYLPGQGISAHIDCEPCFDDTIASLSLSSGCIMDFTNKYDRKNKIKVWLAPMSLIVLSDEARYNWLHSIASRQSDEWEGKKIPRGRRVSLTFRRVIIDKRVT